MTESRIARVALASRVDSSAVGGWVGEARVVDVRSPRAAMRLQAMLSEMCVVVLGEEMFVKVDGVVF